MLLLLIAIYYKADVFTLVQGLSEFFSFLQLVKLAGIVIPLIIDVHGDLIIIFFNKYY